MNKKLLGIAAVALLGVSAAFAATTSTVYFTASGNLTKYEEEAGYGAVDFLTDLCNDNGELTYEASKKYNGELVKSGNSCNAELIKSTQMTNNNSTTNKYYEYAYKGINLSGLTFSQKGDYVILEIMLIPITSNSYYFTFEHSKSVTLDDNTSIISGYSTLDTNKYVTGDAKDKFTYKIGTDPFQLINPDVKSFSYDLTIAENSITYNYSFSDTNEAAKIELNSASTNAQGLFFYIELNEDVTETTKFSDLTISLPEFTKVS